MAGRGTRGSLSALSRLSGRRPWLVVLGWLAVVVVLNVSIPQLEFTVAKHSAPFLPHSIPAAETLREMSQRFGVPESSAFGSVVLVDDGGNGPEAEQTYRELVDRLEADTDNVAYVMDVFSDPGLRDIGLSPDGKAINLLVAASGEVGSTEAQQNTTAIRAVIDELPKPAGLQVYYTGPSPTLADLFGSMDMSLHVITGVSILLITALLMLMYRSPTTVLVPLTTIGVSLAVARPIVSLLGLSEVLPVSNFTIALMTALLLGATTDYAIFILASCHEGRRSGLPVPEALAHGSRRVTGILAASALTIAAAATAMTFTQLGMFRAAGAPIAIAILVALGVSQTLPYALIALLARRGLAEPRPFDERQWRRTGARVVRHAGTLTGVCLVMLLAFSSALLTFRANFDENAMQLRDTRSKQGYVAVQQHWGVNEAAPEYLLISADHDMRNTDDLAALERIATMVAALPEVAYVRAMTRPRGMALPETAVGFQVGVVANRLGEAHAQISAAVPDLDALATGVTRLHDGASSASAQMPRLVAGTREVTSLARSVLDAYESAGQSVTQLGKGPADVKGVLSELSSSIDLVEAMLRMIAGNAQIIETGRVLSSALAPAVDGLSSPRCDADPVCVRARPHLTELDAMSGGAATRLLRQIQAATATPSESIDAALTALPSIRDTVSRLRSLVDRVGTASPQQLRSQLDQLVSGTEQLASGVDQLTGGISQVRGGVEQMVGMIDELSAGLDEAASYLSRLGEHTSAGPAAGFYIPAERMSDSQFLGGQKLLFSPDGTMARMVVVWQVNPYSDAALNASRLLASTAELAAADTSLGTATFASTGLASLSADMRDQVWRDFAVYGVVAVLGVLLVLVVLLRSLLAPLIMVGIVVLSFAAAAGITVVVWQHLIGIDVDWSVLPVSFMALIAVGADYSMLFAARIREEAREGMIRGIIRGFGSTGSVITTAGLVFALTMFALMSGSVINLIQIGFMIGVGLLLDITVVRTVLVPAAMALFGDRFWWPSTSIGDS